MAPRKKAADKPKATNPRKKKGEQPEAQASAEVPKAKGSVPQDNTPKADPEMRALAIKHRDQYSVLKKRLGDAQSKMRAFGKEVKQDGFTMRQIKLMVELSTAEGQEAFRLSVAQDLIAAQYQGAAIGQQLALFLEPDRTPATEIAYDEGVQACIEGKSAKPPYDPSVPQTQSWLKGWNDEHERRMNKFQKINPDKVPSPPPAPEADRASTLAEARDANSTTTH